MDSPIKIRKITAVSGQSASQVADKAAATITISIDPAVGQNRMYIHRTCNFASAYQGFSISGTELKVNIVNMSGASHTLQVGGYIVEWDDE